MPKKFTDFDLQVHRGLRKDWVQSFVDKYGHERNPHGQMKLMCSNLLGLALVEQHLGKRKAKIQLVVAGDSPGTHILVLLRHLRQWRHSRTATQSNGCKQKEMTVSCSSATSAAGSTERRST